MIGTEAVHTRAQFKFVAHAPLDVAWPLFGAEGEKAWAPGWNPVFIWPVAPLDQEGMVFSISHELGTAIWVNTAFDRRTQRIQYVYVIPEIVTTMITLGLLSLGGATQVAVTYERTALNVAANEQVVALAKSDQAAGEEWSRQINECLRARQAKT